MLLVLIIIIIHIYIECTENCTHSIVPKTIVISLLNLRSYCLCNMLKFITYVMFILIPTTTDQNQELQADISVIDHMYSCKIIFFLYAPCNCIISQKKRFDLINVIYLLLGNSYEFGANYTRSVGKRLHILY